MDYNFKEGKARVVEILNNQTDVTEKDKVPVPDGSFSFNNGFYSWVTSVFVDIRDSTILFSKNKKTTVARIVRAFTSEVIEILRQDDNLREIGVRGDCVYAIYTCSQKNEDYEVLDKTIYVNTFIDMLNKLLQEKGLSTLKVGIGIATSQDLVVKAGRKGSSISNLVWIGRAVTFASKLSNIANKNGNDAILMSRLFYNGIIDQLKKINCGQNVDGWFTFKNDDILGEYCGCNVVKAHFSNWITRGMKDD